MIAWLPSTTMITFSEGCGFKAFLIFEGECLISQIQIIRVKMETPENVIQRRLS